MVSCANGDKSMSQQQNSFGPTLSSMRDPRIASYLSIIPGLGQIYNLEPRKGILFFLVGLTNFVSIIVLLWRQQLLNILRAASQELNIAPNPEIADALASLHAGSPALSILFILFIAFTIYAMRDAHDRAMLVRKNEIYAPYVMHLSEATSGSYLFHAVLMITLVLFAFFFLLPSPPHVQVTDIEFLNTQVESKTIQKTNKVSDKNTEAMRDPATKRVAKNPTPQEGARSQPAQTPRAMQKPSAHEAPSQPATRPAQPSKPVTATSEPKPPMNTTPAKPAIHPLAPPVVPARDPSVPQPLQKTDTASLNKTVSPPVNALPALNKPASDPSKLLSSLKPASAPTTNGPSPEHIAIRSNGAPLLIASS